MEKNNLEKTLKELEIQRDSYFFIVKKLSDINISESERNKFINDNRQKIEELNQLSKQISEIEWRLMSPEQQKDYLNKY